MTSGGRNVDAFQHLQFAIGFVKVSDFDNGGLVCHVWSLFLFVLAIRAYFFSFCNDSIASTGDYRGKRLWLGRMRRIVGALRQAYDPVLTLRRAALLSWSETPNKDDIIRMLLSSASSRTPSAITTAHIASITETR